MAIKQINSKNVEVATTSTTRRLASSAGVTGHDLDQPIPGVDKHAPNNRKFVENLVITRETNPLLYKKLMSWD